jgi:tRNA dimethylallyltransferase
LSASPRPGADDRPVGICITGPTASGKTALALALCDRLDCEIISVDSAQVYRGMNIGTAKPGPEILARYPHRLIDIRDPSEPYSAAEFRRDARAAIDEILAAGRTPLLVGGTMLYLRVLLGGIAELPPADPTCRAEIAEIAAREGWEGVHRRLAAVDPQSAARIHPGDPQRLQRALEVYLVSGRPISSYHREQGAPQALPCRLIQIAVLPWDRTILHRRIAQRFEAMLAAGLVDEVRALRRRGDLDPSLPSIRSVGYRQVWAYLDGDYTYAEMVERAIMATRQLAKRQHTWLRTWPELHWLFTDEFGAVVDAEGTSRGDLLPRDVLDAALKIVDDATISR